MEALPPSPDPAMATSISPAANPDRTANHRHLWLSALAALPFRPAQSPSVVGPFTAPTVYLIPHLVVLATDITSATLHPP